MLKAVLISISYLIRISTYVHERRRKKNNRVSRVTILNVYVSKKPD